MSHGIKAENIQEANKILDYGIYTLDGFIKWVEDFNVSRDEMITTLKEMSAKMHSNKLLMELGIKLPS